MLGDTVVGVRTTGSCCECAACRAYISRQLLPTDMREWKAAGILVYTVDRHGLHVLLGKIDTSRGHFFKEKEIGWWVLGEHTSPLSLHLAAS